jgi:outer membrane usher protein FimD/PapC
MTKTIALTVLSLIVIVSAACNFSFSSARITDVTMSKDVSDKMEAVDPTSTFATTDGVVHCLVVLRNAPEKTRVKAVWIAVNAEGQKANEKFGEKEVEGGGNKNAVDFTYTPPPAGFPAGEYKVDIYLNPQPGKEEPPTRSLAFSVKAAPALITSATLSATEDGDSLTEFPAASPVFFCKAVLRGASAGTKVIASWVAVEAQATAPNLELRRVPVVLDAGQNKVSYNLKYANGFLPGRYRVDLYLGDSTTPDKSVPFTVAE